MFVFNTGRTSRKLRKTVYNIRFKKSNVNIITKCHFEVFIKLNHLKQKNLSDAYQQPEFMITDFAKFDRPGQFHVAFLALHEFRKANNGQLPRTRNQVSCFCFKVYYRLVTFKTKAFKTKKS